MKPKSITGLLKKTGGVKGLAEKLGVKSPTVSQVIHGVRPNPRIRSAIATTLNKPIAELWPAVEQEKPVP